MDTQNPQLKFIGYARKSSEDNKERQAASLPDQLYIIEGIKTKHHLQVTDTLQESESAYKKGREVFNSMIEKISRGDANAILVWHANRLARNMTDGGKIIDLFDEKKLVEIRTPSSSYHNTPNDKFMLSLEFSISKKDSDDKSVVVVRGLEKKSREGWRPGVAPEGYLNEKSAESGFRKILTDKERMPFIRKMFELFHNGTSVKEVQRLANKEWHYRTRQRKRMGGRPLALSTIYSILTNSFYCGKFEYPVGSDKWYEGQHEKAISEEVFNEIQAKLGNRSKYNLKHHNYAYTSLMRCGNCDSAIVAEEKWQCICTNCRLKFSLTKKNKDKCPRCLTLIEKMIKPKILHYTYYRCCRKKNPSCKELGVRLEYLEQMIGEKLSKIEISPLFMDWAIRQIKKMNEKERNFREDTIFQVKRTHDETRRRLDNLLQLKISPANNDGSLLSDEKYKEEKEVLEKELKSLEQQLVGIDNRMIQANNDTEKAFNFASKARERFTTGDLKTKRDIFMGLGLHLTLKNRIVHCNSPKYIQSLEIMKKESPLIGKVVAPNKESLETTKMEAKFASIPRVLRGLESHLLFINFVMCSQVEKYGPAVFNVIKHPKVSFY